MFKQKSKRRTIVLVEVLATIALTALLATTSVPRIVGVLDRSKDLEVARNFKQYTDAAIALQASGKSLTEDNLNNYLDKTLKFSTDKSYSKNPYGEEYRYTPISNGFKIESDKYKNGRIVSTRVLTITRNPKGQLDITDTTTSGSTHDNQPIISMAAMFANSQATTLDLSKFDASKITYTGKIFQGSLATTGYAGTEYEKID